MAAARLSCLTFCFLRAARRINGIELRVERPRARGRDFLDRADGAKGTHRRAKQRDTGEKEESFFLGGSRHAGRLLPHRVPAGIEVFRCGAKLPAMGDGRWLNSE
jgi:hypothetical protein